MPVKDINVGGSGIGGIAPIWRRIDTIVVLSGGTTAKVDIPLNGRMEEYVLVVPLLDGATTATLSLLDEDSQNWYASSAFALSTTQNVIVTRLLCGLNTFQIVCSGAQTADRTFTLYLKGSR
jgi:hypothetical protein